MGIQNNLKVRDSFYISQPCNSANKFLWLRNSEWDIWGVKFWSRDFLWVLIFSPIRSSLSLESTVPLLGLHKLWKIKITPVKTQTRNNVLSVIACLAGKDTQEVLYTDLSKHQAVIQSDCDSCQIFAMLIFGCEILY